jgi:alpha-beta hydrolase superfamily lysophospholipase
VRADVALFAEPVLVLQAGEEAWVDKPAQSDFCAAASSCELVVKEGSYHEIFNELDRAQTVRNVVEFLDERIR